MKVVHIDLVSEFFEHHFTSKHPKGGKRNKILATKQSCTPIQTIPPCSRPVVCLALM